MKKTKDSPILPSVTKEEVQRQLPKTKAILLRLTEDDKEAIDAAAKSVHLTATEYLVRCHELISEKLPR
ncbi:MAG: hypothetical protein NTV51_10170 [Verrucomicrobia bacterium]|nr:hypothetical protein [Verrucomicrobiota bacterium]